MIKFRNYFFGYVLALFILMLLWMDELALKTSQQAIGPAVELVKIVLLTFIAYKLSKFIFKKFSLEQKITQINPRYLFLFLCILLNSYITTQYLHRTISNRIIHAEFRHTLNSKIHQARPIGWGFTSDSLSIKEYNALRKYTTSPELPIDAKNIHVYDWFELQDYERRVTFDLLKSIDIVKFYAGDTTVLRYLRTIDYDIDPKTNEIIRLDTSVDVRYMWEIVEI